MYNYTLSLISVLDVVGVQYHVPAALPPGKRHGTQCAEGRRGSRFGRPPPGFDPRTVQAVASRYTDRVILAHIQCKEM